MKPEILKYYLILLFCLAIGVLQAQDDESAEKIELIMEQTETEQDFSELLDNIENLKEHPINLNTASKEELLKLFFLDELVISNLIAYREQYGDLVSIYELQVINGFSYFLIRQILPYVTVKKSPVLQKPITFNNLRKYGKNELWLRYQQVLNISKGYKSISENELAKNPNARYLGTPQKLYARYGFNYNERVRFGITAEKDAGEEFFAGNQKQGFDFYSGFFYLHDVGKMKKLVVGDYQLQFGQSLALWTGLGFGKSSDAVEIKKYGQSIKPSTSANENNYLRGIASTFKFGKLEADIFASYTHKDATVTSQGKDAEENFIIILQETGYHRTPNELAKRKSIVEQLAGAHLSFQHKQFKIGTLAYNSIYTPVSLSQFSKWSSLVQNGWHSSVDFSWVTRKCIFFGEAARNQTGKYAVSAGMQALLTETVRFSALYRNYNRDYKLPYAAAFRENTHIGNEKGIYLGMLANLFPRTQLDLYADFFKFPWLRYQVDAPSKGVEYLAKVSYSLTSRSQIYFLYRYKTKEENTQEIVHIKYLENITNERFRINFKTSPTLQWSLQSRIEFSFHNKISGEKTQGFLAFQDISYRLSKIPLNLTLRYAVFETDTYDDRIYAYENDMLNCFSIPAYYYKGSRFYILVHWNINKAFELWIRYAMTHYANRQTIGSGLDEINSPTKSDIGVQLRMKF